MAKKIPSKKSAKNEIGIIYARYSSHNQKDASIEQQVDACMKLAKELGLKIVETYGDRAVSGKTDKRPNFQRMMKDAEKGRFSYVLAWKSNRMGRNMLQAMMNEAKLNELGIRVIYVEEDFDDTAAGRFALRSMMNVNQFYSENMAEDIRRGLMDNAIQAKVTGSLPYGYKASEDQRYEIDAPKDDIVREIYTRVACGDMLVDIIADLNARGLKTKTGHAWNRSSFNKILTNERYRGIYIYGDIRTEGAIPRIVSDELFFKVQEVLKMKKNPRGRHRVNGDYLLTGKLFCGHCKSPMTGISGTSRTNDLHYYYTCQKRRMEHDCDKKNVRRDEVEELVASAIQKHILQDEVIEAIADKTIEYNEKQQAMTSVALLEEELATVKASIKNLMKAIEAGIITETTRSRLIELEAEQSQLTGRIAAEKADIVPIERDDLIAGLAMFRDGNVKDKNYQARLFDTFLVAVYLYDDSLEIVFSFTGSKNTVEIPLGDLDHGLTSADEVSDRFVYAPPASTIKKVPFCQSTNGTF